MNYKALRGMIGKILLLEGCIMFFPFVVSLIYKENFINWLSYLIVGAVLVGISFLLRINTEKNDSIGPKEGLVIVGLSWMLLAMFGALPFVISGEIPNYVDALFEITSGFTTTGSSILTSVEDLAHSSLFWRALSQWIGGMGILVFILAFGNSNDNTSIHLLRAETTGPSVGKLTSKMKITTRILYIMYIGLTLIEIILLAFDTDKNMDFFSCVCLSFSTLATGGFSVLNSGCASYSIYAQYVISIFMILAGVNFSVYYLILIKKVKQALKNEELIVYFSVIVLAVIGIMISSRSLFSGFEENFRTSLFQVASIITTTGFATSDFTFWPIFSQTILVILMILGSCAGSTSGGMKMSRIIILSKSSILRIKKKGNDKIIESINIDGKPIDFKVVHEVLSFAVIYFFIIFLCTFLIGIDGFDFTTNFTASLSSLSNVGPGLNNVGPYGNYASFSSFSKIVMTIEMITGRLELFPILILFNPKVWRKY